MLGEERRKKRVRRKGKEERRRGEQEGKIVDSEECVEGLLMGRGKRREENW